jgi:hypothetical protein
MDVRRPGHLTLFSRAAFSFTGKSDLPSAYAVTDFAGAAIAVAALSIAELVGRVFRHP